MPSGLKRRAHRRTCLNPCAVRIEGCGQAYLRHPCPAQHRIEEGIGCREGVAKKGSESLADRPDT